MLKSTNKVLQSLGWPYTTKIIDGEEVVYRDLENGYDIEVLGCRSEKYAVYVWMVAPHREIVGIYSGIRGEADLKDTLGYVAFKYGNLSKRIQVEREESPR